MLLFIDCNHPGVVYAGDENSTLELDHEGGQSWTVSRAQALAYLTDGWRLALWMGASPITTIIEHDAPEYPPVREQEPDEDPYFEPEPGLHWAAGKLAPLVGAKRRERRSHSRKRGHSRSRDRYLAVEAGYADLEDDAAAAEYEHYQATYEER